MNEILHRIFSGNPLTPRQLRAAGFVALVWFLMDTVEWMDWATDKIFKTQSCTIIQIPTPLSSNTKGNITYE